MKLDCPKCEAPLIVERPGPLSPGDQLAGCKCAACGAVLSEDEIGQAIKNALEVLFGKKRPA